MKKISTLSLLILLFSLSLQAIACAEPFVKNEVLLQKGADSYVEARHIVIRGNNEEIGKALADIAQKDYGVKALAKYPDEVYRKAIDIYLQNHYPALRERAMGVARSYHAKYDQSLSIFSQLAYDAGPWNGCSSVYYPPSYTPGGAGMLAHNMDYPLCSIKKLLKIHGEDSPPMFTRNYVVELYPDKGYASIGVGTGDLLSVVSGMNEKGLIAALHTDNYTMINTDPKPDISGLIFPTQVVRYILDNCRTVEEAKIAVLNHKLSLTFEPAHLLIADREGKSLVVEINPKNMRVELTENSGKPQPFTNHPLYRFSDPQEFPSYGPLELDNTFMRYNQLSDLLKGKKQFSPDDALANQVAVLARWNNPKRGMANPTIPNRTIWTDIFDQKDLTMKVRFYMKDSAAQDDLGDPQSLVFSDFFRFALKR
ncbi:MAG: C45 family peptidase [Candidatus Eremiobacteraeota bacterium]|nr:C45 family peptidase [Candidatus Eremiobacteraeota bacterium]